MKIHIYTQRLQPATEQFDQNATLSTDCCKRKRPAKDCMIQIFYDAIYAYCKEGSGCKNAEEIKAKQARIFARRSAGQKKRWEKS